MALLFPEPTVKCFTDDQLRRGLDAVILAHELRGGRCVICGEDNDDTHDAQPHPFVRLDLVAIFLEAASDPTVLPHGQGDAEM